MADDPLRSFRTALVIGLGRSGDAAITALRAAGVDVVAVDEQPDPPGAASASDLGADVHAGADPAAHLDGVDLVVPSPGVPEHAPVLVQAAAAGIPVWSEPELGWRLHPRRVVAVTGTNGKTTVTELTAAMLTEAAIPAVACGNIGTPFTSAAATTPPDTVLVAELSSFQLRFCHRLRPEVGVLLNLAPDHLDWHGDLTAYGAAKARIWQAQEEGDWAVVNADDAPASALAVAHAPAGLARFSGTGPAGPGPAVAVEDGALVARLPRRAGSVVALAELVPDAPHHHANVAAAACAAILAGASPDDAGAAARRFRPGRHRMEVVAEVHGVTFVDDSKATNPHAAAAALAAYPSVVWIAGGLAKGVDLEGLGRALGAVRHAVLIGDAADALVRVCDDNGVTSERAPSMEAAVDAAARAACAGDTVLLAPACASFDMFRDYADRGDRFADAVRRLATEGAAHG